MPIFGTLWCFRWEGKILNSIWIPWLLLDCINPRKRSRSIFRWFLLFYSDCSRYKKKCIQHGAYYQNRFRRRWSRRKGHAKSHAADYYRPNTSWSSRSICKEYQILMHELTQQIHANTELMNQLNGEERRGKTRRGYLSFLVHSLSESSMSSDFYHKSIHRRLDENYAEASEHLNAANFGQAGIGPSTGHEAAPSSRRDAPLQHCLWQRSCSYRSGC